MIGSKDYIEEDWEKLSDLEKMFSVEEEEESWDRFWKWYCSQEADIIVISQSEKVDELPF